jgi:glycosyltransferase involved in cell wall biosynthesis
MKVAYKKKILFLSPYPIDKAPSQRLKYEQYYGHIANAGYEITTSSFVSEEFWKIIYKPGKTVKKVLYTLDGYLRRIKDLFSLSQYDIVYIHLWVTPLGPPVFEWLVNKLAKKIVYDIDDLIYLKPKSKANPLISLIKSENKPKYLMSKADHVITCTPYLDQYVRQYSANTTDISSTINTDIYIPKADYETKAPIVIGWSGSYSTSKYLLLLKDVLLRLKEHVNFKLLVIGDENFYIEGLDVEAISWNERSEVVDLKKIDIGLYPLPNEEWVLGKSGLKALQYMALGIPTIATAIGANFRVIENDVSGYLVNNEEEWLNSLLELSKDVELRQKIGLRARERVVQFYSIEANKEIYISALNSLS